MWIGKFKIFKDVDYLISNQNWIIIDYYQGYLYSGSTLYRVVKQVFLEWRQDKHLVG